MKFKIYNSQTVPYLRAGFFGAAFLAGSSLVFAQQTKNVVQLSPTTIHQVMMAMTLEEKSKLVVGMGFKMPGATEPPKENKQGQDIGGFKMPPSDPDAYRIPEKVPGAAGRLHGIPRLGIPSLTVSDGPAGVRINPERPGSSKKYYATAFPVATLLASSWDVDIVNKVGKAFGSEVHDYGVDILLAPALNIQRNPLGGRNFEYYSEDPLLAGKITAAMVKGIQSNGVGTSIKHFAANNQESNRTGVNAIVSERALREIYLKGFEIAIKESSPWTVMSSYNKINGVYTSARRDLLTTILRDEWHYKGFVMTDWFGGDDPVAQMRAGNDLIMPGGPNQSQLIVDAVNNGTLKIEQLNLNVERILRIIVKSLSFKQIKNNDNPNLLADARVSRTAATEGMVLLKNDSQSLPLTTHAKVATFGNTTFDMIAGGTGSGDVNKAYTVSLLQGLENAGFVIDKVMAANYEGYLKEAKLRRPKPKNFFELPATIPEYDVLSSIDDLANANDIAIVTIGRNAGEGNDRTLDNDYYLSAKEKELLSAVSKAFHKKNKKVIVVLNIGGVMDVASWRNEADAILLAWQPGLEAGNAIADVLSGKVNPSGKLAVTFPVEYKDVPSAGNFPGTPKEKPLNVTYGEGIYVGYRYYNTFGIKPAYAFGHGLSYTKFTYSNIKISSPIFNRKINVSVVITNKGKTKGKEVVQLYLHAPGLSMNKPSQELKGFAKTALLQPGHSQMVNFTITPADLASYDSKISAWVAEAGNYIVRIGSSSDGIKQQTNFKCISPILVEQDHLALSPQAAIKETIVK